MKKCKVMDKYKYSTLVEIAYRNYVIEHLHEPNMIIMHPKTLENLMNESRSNINGFSFVHNGDNQRYRGIEILRSLDLNEDEIKI